MKENSTSASRIQESPLVGTSVARSQAAIELVKLGLRVFPAIANDKRPLIAKWPEKASSDISEVRRVWAEHPDLNIGCVLDDGFFLDVDDKEGKQGSKSLARMLAIYEDFPPTYTQRSPTGGRHIAFRCTAEIAAQIKTCTNEIPGFPDIDVRAGRTGYVIGAGSSLPAGEYTVESNVPIADSPNWLIGVLPKATSRKDKLRIESSEIELDTPQAVERASAYLDGSAPEAVAGNSGDTATYKIACKVRDYAVSYDTALDLMRGYNAEKAFPPWEDDDLERIVRSAYNHAQNAIGIASAEAEFEAVEIVDKQPPKKRGLHVVDWADSAPTLEQPYLIDGILDLGTMVVTYGDSNVGKTYIKLDQAFHIAAGRDWNGHKVKQGLVVYVAAEGGTGFLKRIEAFKRHYGAAAIPFTTVPCPVDLQSERADTNPLIKLIQEAETRHGTKCVLVVIDTLARAIAGGDENTAVDMSKFVVHCDRIRAATGATVDIIHHTGKDKAKGARGSSALRAATDTEIEVDVGCVRVTKQRDMDRVSDMRFELVTVEIGRRSDGAPVTACVVRWISSAETDFAAPIDGKLEEALQAFENALAAKGESGCALSFTEWQQAFAAARSARGKKTGEKQALVRCSKGLIDAGYIAKTQTGQYVRIAAK